MFDKLFRSQTVVQRHLNSPLRQARSGVEFRLFEGLDHSFAGPDGRVDAAFLKALADRIPQTLK